MTRRPNRPLVGGVFIGGRGERMGGLDKGLLASPEGESLLARTLALAPFPCVLVGTPRDPSAHAALGVPILPDAVGGIGPLGGLLALLELARGGYAVALACDMPHVTRASLEELARAPEAAIVAPRREGRWEPLFARYDAELVLPRARENAARGNHALQALFQGDARELLLADARVLEDWDTPEDRR